jgi:hypothetical protein
MKGFTNNPMSVVKRKKKDGKEALAQAAANNETPQDVHNEGTTENAQLRAKVSQLIQAQLAAGADHKRIVLKNAQLMADIKMLKQAQVGVAAGAAVDAADAEVDATSDASAVAGSVAASAAAAKDIRRKNKRERLDTLKESATLLATSTRAAPTNVPN